ncbi:GFA family protein [Hyphococcus luteus]|uniref:Aldehyde-activating protein n=1 Tax=Hyphococcus luteus TaxID=2058213 RepID=A0A2S7K0B7_9PROT|nr:GFA family protein [Marinicaulis flavus]PQA85947.1 aldehyde-activating protein [Marinicaulis flavus]
MKSRKIEVSGGCQCGAVRYRASEMLDNAHLCHCRMCQKAVGNLFAALVAAPNDKLTWTRGRPAVFKSSDHAERGFCAACGTPLFYNSLDNDRINLTIGSLDAPERFPPVSQIGLEGRVSWFADLAGLEEGGETGADGNEDWAQSVEASSRQHPDHDTESWPPVP